MATNGKRSFRIEIKGVMVALNAQGKSVRKNDIYKYVFIHTTYTLDSKLLVG